MRTDSISRRYSLAHGIALADVPEHRLRFRRSILARLPGVEITIRGIRLPGEKQHRDTHSAWRRAVRAGLFELRGLELPAVLECENTLVIWCPACEREHRHGGGGRHREGGIAYGPRVAHCTEHDTVRSYELVPPLAATGERIDDGWPDISLMWPDLRARMAQGARRYGWRLRWDRCDCRVSVLDGVSVVLEYERADPAFFGLVLVLCCPEAEAWLRRLYREAQTSQQTSQHPILRLV